MLESNSLTIISEALYGNLDEGIEKFDFNETTKKDPSQNALEVIENDKKVWFTFYQENLFLPIKEFTQMVLSRGECQIY